MDDPHFRPTWWNRRQFLQSGAIVVTGAYGLFPGFASAAEIPD